MELGKGVYYGPRGKLKKKTPGPGTHHFEAGHAEWQLSSKMDIGIGAPGQQA